MKRRFLIAMESRFLYKRFLESVMNAAWDVIIIGGGHAGCEAAARRRVAARAPCC